jgi:DNA processing protein
MGLSGVGDEYSACLALAHTPGLGPRTWKSLLERFGSARAAIDEAKGWVGQGLVREKVTELLLGGAWQEAAQREQRAVAARGDAILLWTGDEYPQALREIPDPPLYLYVQGRTGLLGGDCIAVVGARQCSRYGRDMASKLAEGLSSSGITVVSGFASGIDRQAHASSLDGAGGSIAVLGTGLDLIYPASNRDLWERLSDKGLIVTELPPGTRPEGPNFPKRNRIISGISLGVVVVEAAPKSGSLITARMAMEQGRDVFALPGPANLRTFDGCHELIREGAVLVRSAEDILTELAPRLGRRPEPVLTPRTRPELGPEERRVVEVIGGREQAHIDHIARTLGMESARVSQTLLMLELKQVVTKLPGMYYRLAV